MQESVLNKPMITLENIENEWKKKIKPQNNIKFTTVSLFHSYFDFPNRNYCPYKDTCIHSNVYIQMALKMKKESSYSFVEKKHVC